MYVDYHPATGDMGSIWCSGAVPGGMRRGKMPKAIKEGLPPRLQAQFEADVEAGMDINQFPE